MTEFKRYGMTDEDWKTYKELLNKEIQNDIRLKKIIREKKASQTRADNEQPVNSVRQRTS